MTKRSNKARLNAMFEFIMLTIIGVLDLWKNLLKKLGV